MFDEQDDAAQLDDLGSLVVEHFAIGVFEAEHRADPFGVDVAEMRGQFFAVFADGQCAVHGDSIKPLEKFRSMPVPGSMKVSRLASNCNGVE